MSKKIIIVGAGFAGVSAGKELAKSKNCKIQIIDRRNHHLFQPLLYQVAMAGLNPSDIAVPIRKIFSPKDHLEITLAEVSDVDINKNKINYDNKWHDFDYLILSCGAKHFYFGHHEWELVAPGLKNIEQATEIRRRILTAFEMAEKEDDPDVRASYLTFAIVGGGPTGVELAGAIREMASKTLWRDFKLADLSKTRVILIEAGSRLLSSFPETQSLKTEKALKSLGVEVRKNCRASNLSEVGLAVGEEWIKARTIIWAAGVKPSKLTEKVDSEKDSQGRIIVEKDLSLRSNKNVFVLGDQASVKDQNGNFLPGIAPVAIQEGQFVGRLISNELVGRPRKEFKYWDKGIMATIGRSKAVVSVGGVNLHGLMAWMIWVLIHIIYLMRFKNKVFVFFQWVWSYFSFGKGARLITHKTWRFYSGDKISYK